MTDPPGRAVRFLGQLYEALRFNLSRNPNSGLPNRRTIWQEEWLEKATAVGLRRTRSCAYVYYTTDVENWCLRDGGREMGRSNAVLMQAAAQSRTRGGGQSYTSPVLDHLHRFITLTNRLWVYRAVLESRAGSEIHGLLGLLAAETFIPRNNNNRLSNLSAAQRSRQLIGEQLAAAVGAEPNGLRTLVVRIVDHFGSDPAVSPGALLDFLADRLPRNAAPPPDAETAWAVLKVLAGYDAAQRVDLVAACEDFEKARRGEHLPAGNALETWLNRLPKLPEDQYPAQGIMTFLAGDLSRKSTAKIAVESADEEPSRRDRLHQKLVALAAPQSWQASLLATLAHDCTPNALRRWVGAHAAEPLSLADSALLRAAVKGRIDRWVRYVTAGRRTAAPPCCALLELELPEVPLGRLEEAAQALESDWPAWRILSPAAREVIHAGILSKRLEQFAVLVGDARDAIDVTE